eukprot:TRINITY_DN8282_c2_g6_i1.p2 TRINITY_DN8282_c2_g6~~TRINITY_DN8282_c2_g6_i1.p2  ORF type:complete len:102 (+),score=12.12 TRINITY_DN8282_c2_g6_i1:127-432(+)
MHKLKEADVSGTKLKASSSSKVPAGMICKYQSGSTMKASANNTSRRHEEIIYALEELNIFKSHTNICFNHETKPGFVAAIRIARRPMLAASNRRKGCFSGR